MRILVVEDHAPTARLLRDSLAAVGYAVDIALTGEDGEEMAGLIHYDGIVLDIMLPGKSGLEVCRSLREKNILTPVMFLTGMDQNVDIMNGFNTGADDYLTKPFRLDMLYARVGALVRRSPWAAAPLLKAGDLVMDTVNREVWYKESRLDIIGIELAMLEMLMRHPNLTITRGLFDEHLRDAAADIRSNVLQAHISNLRARFPGAEGESLIQTVRGAGYRLKIPGIVRIPVNSHSSTIPCVIIFLLCLLSTFQLQLDWFSYLPGVDG